ncbi:MAG: nucleotidyltransferase domain-containing protein [Ruminococcaceae bacterium]|nr:nucleotidyltransferase domain-containing protein [Oscillospiraceae bacterium]
MATIQHITKAVSEVAKNYPITKIILFGSYADGTNTEHSDIDLLVEFETMAVSLLIIADIKYKIEDILGVDVDIIHAPLPEGAMIDINKAVEIYAA